MRCTTPLSIICELIISLADENFGIVFAVPPGVVTVRELAGVTTVAFPAADKVVADESSAALEIGSFNTPLNFMRWGIPGEPSTPALWLHIGWTSAKISTSKAIEQNTSLLTRDRVRSCPNSVC